MNRLHITTLAIAALTFLAACGDKPGERALSGAGIGAGVGAVLGGDAVDGALIGGAIGGAAGGLTKKSDIDLGKPIWK